MNPSGDIAEYDYWSKVPIYFVDATYSHIMKYKQQVMCDQWFIFGLGILPKILPKLWEAAIFRLGIYRNVHISWDISLDKSKKLLCC